jgi:TPR repeat protein
MRALVFLFSILALSASGPARAQGTLSLVDEARAALQRGDWATAKARLGEAAQRREPRALVLLGDLHYPPGGTGDFAEDPDTACGLYERAASQNFAEGLFGAGRCYLEGRGRPKEPSDALRFFERASERGSARSWCAMGRMYFLGEGIPVDAARGVALCRQGSSMGDAEADAELGVRYLNGQGVPKSFADARPWLDRAAQRGSAQAARALAQAYTVGNGVPRDLGQAGRYLELAAKSGDLDAAVTIVNQRAATLLTAAADRRMVVDSMYWLTIIARAHPDPKRREIAQHDLAELRTRFANLTMEADFKLEKEPLRPVLPR